MTPAASNSPEIGRELLYHDLPGRERTVMVLQKDGEKIFLTMWLVEVSPILVFFRANEIGVTLGLFPQLDGTLRDDLDRQIHVFEYLGAI